MKKLPIVKTIKRARDFFTWWRKEYFSAESVLTIYNTLATEKKYDRTVDFAKRSKRLKKIYQRIIPEPKTVLDLACGTGVAIDAMPWKERANITGLDISEGMLDVARQRFVGYKNIKPLNKNFLSLDFEEESFDCITMTYASRFVPKDQEIRFAEHVTTLLKSNGTLVIVTFDDPFGNLGIRLSDLTGLPRAYNLRMNYAWYLKNLFTKHLTLEHNLSLDRYFAYRHRALIFKKSSSYHSLSRMPRATA